MPDNNPTRKPFETAAKTTRETMDRGAAAAEQVSTNAEKSFESTADGIRQFNVKMLEMAQVNVKAALELVSELTQAKEPPQIFEIWSRHAQNQIQRLTDQSQELATLGQKIASSGTRPLLSGFDKVFSRAS